LTGTAEGSRRNGNARREGARCEKILPKKKGCCQPFF